MGQFGNLKGIDPRPVQLLRADGAQGFFMLIVSVARISPMNTLGAQDFRASGRCMPLSPQLYLLCFRVRQ